MKKRTLSLAALLTAICLLILCAGCSKSAETAEPAPTPSATDAGSSSAADSAAGETVSGRNAALDAAFASGESLRLEPADLPAGSLVGAKAQISATRPDGTALTFAADVRIDTPTEAGYYVHGGILPYVIRGLAQQSAAVLV